MAEPTKYPEWTSNNPGQIIEPDAAKKQAGWAAGERPPNQYMNWLQNLEYLWAKLLNEKTKNVEPIQLRSAATAAWNGATLTFAQPIEIVFRNGNSPTRINKILAADSPIALADGDVVVVYRDRTNASPVTLALQAVYANLAAGQYAIVAETSLTSTKQENEMLLFRRKGTDLEVPMFGISYPTGSTISFGRAFPGAHTHDAADIVSGTLADARIAQSNVTQHQAALALAASQITSGTFVDARIAASNVTQHQAALSILESQIADGTVFPRLGANETVTGEWSFNTSPPKSSVTPTLADQLTRKGYVDGLIAGGLAKFARGSYTGNGAGTQDIAIANSITPVLIFIRTTANGDPMVSDLVFIHADGFQSYSSWNSSMQEGGAVIFNQGYANAGSGITSVSSGHMVVNGNANQNTTSYHYIVFGF